MIRLEDVLHRLHCDRCGATWPSQSDQAPCPVCLLDAGIDPNAGGSPSPGEDLTVGEPPAGSR